MKTLKEQIEVMQAALDGKNIEVDEHGWGELSNPQEEQYNWELFDYRIKPEPLEFWVNVYSSGRVYLHDTEAKAKAMYEDDENVILVKVREVTE